MANKKNRLIERARQTVRDPRSPRLLETGHDKKKLYRIVAVSLYAPEADFLNETTEALRKAGNLKANRSLVAREAILRLQESLKEKNPNQILSDFNEHQAKRVNE